MRARTAGGLSTVISAKAAALEIRILSAARPVLTVLFAIRAGRQTARILTVELDVTFDEAAFGCEQDRDAQESADR